MNSSQEAKISQQQVSDIIDKCGGERLQHCKTCEDCVSTCFLTNTYPDMTPRDIPKGLIDGSVQELVDSEFIWACTLCTLCTVDCPKEIHMDVIIRSLRGLARQQGKGPKRLEEGLAKIKEVGNSVGIDTEEFVDSVEWLGEELAEEIEGIDEDEFTIPVDKQGAEMLYVPNPREFTSAPRMFSVYIKFLLTIGADWTFASNICDISNWAYYMGDDETNIKLIRNVVDTARRLGVKTLVTTECGHGFKILRKDAEALLGEPLGFEVVSIVEVAHRCFKDGSLRLVKGALEEKVTYHDPCNVGRKLGIYEPPRELLKYLAPNYVEMTHHSKYGLCCGGGGGVAQNTEMGRKRLEFGKAIQEQVVETGAQIVASSCQMCLAQLIDIQEHYKLPVKMKSLMELVMDSLAE